MNNTGRNIILGILAFLMTGCTHNYVGRPELYEVTNEHVSPFKVVDNVSLINGNTPNDERILLEMGLHTHLGDYHQFTDSVIKEAEVLLSKHGMTQKQTGKSLKLTIKNIERIPAVWVFRIVTHVEVEDHLGNKYQIKGDNATGGNLDRAINGSLHKVVTSIFSKEEIRNYLTN